MLVSLATFGGHKVKNASKLEKTGSHLKVIVLWICLACFYKRTFNSSSEWKCHLNVAEEYEISTNTNQYWLLSWFIMCVLGCNSPGWRQPARYVYLVAHSQCGISRIKDFHLKVMVNFEPWDSFRDLMLSLVCTGVGYTVGYVLWENRYNGDGSWTALFPAQGPWHKGQFPEVSHHS